MVMDYFYAQVAITETFCFIRLFIYVSCIQVQGVYFSYLKALDVQSSENLHFALNRMSTLPGSSSFPSSAQCSIEHNYCLNR